MRQHHRVEWHFHPEVPFITGCMYEIEANLLNKEPWRNEGGDLPARRATEHAKA
jgi:hypothetical protein